MVVAGVGVIGLVVLLVLLSLLWPVVFSCPIAPRPVCSALCSAGGGGGGERGGGGGACCRSQGLQPTDFARTELYSPRYPSFFPATLYTSPRPPPARAAPPLTPPPPSPASSHPSHHFTFPYTVTPLLRWRCRSYA